MATLGQRVDNLVGEIEFPTTRAELLGSLGDDDLDLIQALEAIGDDSFVNRTELEQRLRDAMGVPDAVASHSALDDDPDWVPPA